MPSVILTKCNEKLYTHRSWLYLSYKIGSDGIPQVFRCHTLCLRVGVHEKTVPLCKVFELPKDPRLLYLFLFSLWILGDLDLSCDLKKTMLQSEVSDLLSGSHMSLSNPLWAKADPEWFQNGPQHAKCLNSLRIPGYCIFSCFLCGFLEISTSAVI